MIKSTLTQNFTEGSITYSRHYCKEGFVDKWMGSHDACPNQYDLPKLQSGNFCTYYRLNGEGAWICSNEFFGVFNALISRDELETINAYELWHRCRKLAAKVA